VTKADCKACAGLLGTGAGRPMMSSAVTELVRADYAAAMLWVLDANAGSTPSPVGRKTARHPVAPCPTAPIPPT
jgi:hypothetical protein